MTVRTTGRARPVPERGGQRGEFDATGAGVSVGDEGAAGFRARVLVVDDDQVDRMAVRRHLAHVSGDIVVEEAEGVLAAIDRLTAERFDCVVLDYNLPDGDGLTFLRGLRTAGVETPVVMLTGQEDAAVATDLMLAGAAAYIPKAALSPALLLDSIRRAVRTGP